MLLELHGKDSLLNFEQSFNKESKMFFREKNKVHIKNGKKRTITKFCWFPTYVLNGWIWLERVTIEQQAFNMSYEASRWVNWHTTKRIDT